MLSTLLETASRNDSEIELLFLDDEQIRSYYKDYFGEDRATDVIAFPMEEEEFLGSILISMDTAKRQAKEHGKSLWDEIRFLIIHGFLHLLGHDHAEPEEEKIMKMEETNLLERTANI